MTAIESSGLMPIDTTDLDRWVGQPVPGGRLKDPVTAMDIRRWVQALDNTNPLHWDERHAAESVFGALVAPQSFVVACDVGQGARPSIVGTIPGSHMLFGGDEWWFFGPRVHPGDSLSQDRMFFDYRVRETKFAGPTVFGRGDTTHANQRGEFVARQRSTSIRYLVENARRLASFSSRPESELPAFTQADLESFAADRDAYVRWVAERGHRPRPFKQVEVGEKIPRRIVGPHTVGSFAIEYLAHGSKVWGAVDAGNIVRPDAGWLSEMRADEQAARVDPRKADGVHAGPSRGHLDGSFASRIGLPRPYGYGASMSAWMLDHVANWAGEHGRIWHSKIVYRSPVFAGDVSIIDAAVTGTGLDEHRGWSVVDVAATMTNQVGTVLATGILEVVLGDEPP